METGNTVYCSTREEWRNWLSANHANLKEIWLIYYKKSSGKPRVSYDDAVEEALCFGWIDSTTKKFDEERYIQRFTPRKLKSEWSVSNVRRVEKLLKEGKMTEAGLYKYEYGMKNGLAKKAVPKPGPDVILPADLEQALKVSEAALDFFSLCPPSYRRMCITWISEAKRPETRRKRIVEVVQLSAARLRIGIK